MLQTRTGLPTGRISPLSARLHASTIRNINGTTHTASTASTAFTVLIVWVQFTAWVSTTTMYLHSLCPLHPLDGFNSLYGSPPPPCPGIYCIDCIYCIHCIHCIHRVHCMGSIHCMGLHHPHISTFTVFTVFTAFTVWVQFPVLVLISTMYPHSLCLLCGFNSLCGSPLPPCTYIHCIHCVHYIHCIHPLESPLCNSYTT